MLRPGTMDAIAPRSRVMLTIRVARQLGLGVMGLLWGLRGGFWFCEVRGLRDGRTAWTPSRVLGPMCAMYSFSQICSRGRLDGGVVCVGDGGLRAEGWS
jgi:hypothetical protein